MIDLQTHTLTHTYYAILSFCSVFSSVLLFTVPRVFKSQVLIHHIASTLPSPPSGEDSLYYEASILLSFSSTL